MFSKGEAGVSVKEVSRNFLRKKKSLKWSHLSCAFMPM